MDNGQLKREKKKGKKILINIFNGMSV